MGRIVASWLRRLGWSWVEARHKRGKGTKNRKDVRRAITKSAGATGKSSDQASGKAERLPELAPASEH